MTKLKITIDPRAFDTFEGTQEELDELVKMIQNLTPEELEANSRELSEEEAQELFSELENRPQRGESLQ